MSEMFGMSCNMTVEDAEESDEEIDFNDTPSKNITKLQIPSKHPRLNNLRQQKSMDKVKENPKLNEKSVEKSPRKKTTPEKLRLRGTKFFAKFFGVFGCAKIFSTARKFGKL